MVAGSGDGSLGLEKEVGSCLGVAWLGKVLKFVLK